MMQRLIERTRTAMEISGLLKPVLVPVCAAVLPWIKRLTQRSCVVRIESNDGGKGTIEAVLYSARDTPFKSSRTMWIRNKALMVPAGTRFERVENGIAIRLSETRSVYGKYGESVRVHQVLEVRGRNQAAIGAYIASAEDAFKAFRDSHSRNTYTMTSSDAYECRPECPGARFETLLMPVASRIKEAVQTFMASEELYADLGLKWRLSLMLHGRPGCGKTSVAGAIARMTRRTLVTIMLSGIKTLKELRNAFQFVSDEIGDCSNVVIVCEEFDTWRPACQRRREVSESSEADSSSCTSWSPLGAHSVVSSDYLERKEKEAQDNELSILLNMLDGSDSYHGLIVIFTTNHLARFDPAIVRPGRMRCFEFEELDADTVDRYFELHFKRPLPAEYRVGLRPVTLAQLSELLMTRDQMQSSRGSR